MEGGPSDFPQGFPCPAVLWILPAAFRLRLQGFHPLWLAFPKPFGWLPVCLMAVRNPGVLRTPVWAGPLSLAATRGFEFSFFSSGYLDVSVPRVPLHMLWIHIWMHRVYPMRVSPFRHPRLSGYLLLPAAFRSLSRLSSAPSAKASALRPFCLTVLSVLRSVGKRRHSLKLVVLCIYCNFVLLNVFLSYSCKISISFL